MTELATYVLSEYANFTALQVDKPFYQYFHKRQIRTL